MNQPAGAVPTRDQIVLAYVCQHAEDLREAMCEGQAGSPQPVEEVLEAARTSGDVSGPIRRLHDLLQADGDHLGIYGQLADDRGSELVSRLPGARRARIPSEHLFAYRCPGRRCARTQSVLAVDSAPRCVVVGRALEKGPI